MLRKTASGIMLVILLLNVLSLSVHVKLSTANEGVAKVKFIADRTMLSPENEMGNEIKVAVVIENVTNLYGLSVKVYINDTYFDYVSHTTTIPVEDYPDPVPPSPYPGILHAEVVAAKDEYDPTTHILEVGYSSKAPAPAFSGNGTVCTITIKVINHPIGNGSINVLAAKFTEIKLAGYGAPPPPISYTSEDLILTIVQPPGPTLKIDEYNYEGATPHHAAINVSILNLHQYWDLAGFEFWISFDPSAIQVENIDLGYFSKYFNLTYPVFREIDNENGTIHVGYVIDPQSLTGRIIPYGNGTLLMIETVANSSSPIKFIKSKLASAPHPERSEPPWNNKPYSISIPHNTVDGSIVIEFPPLPPQAFPYLFVYPQNITAAPGDTVTVYICIFNLSANIYKTNWSWTAGEPPPPYYENGIHVYPLGYLLGFDIKFRWDPTILEYINHTVTVPVEEYPDPIPPLNFTGTLHEPIQDVKEEINATEGTIWIAKAHLGMEYYNGNGTIAKINFKVKREGATPLEIYEAKLATNFRIVQQDYPEANKDLIIFTVGNGCLRALEHPTVTAIFDFHTKALNLLGVGRWASAYIEFPEGYNVSHINVSTTLLNDTIPVDVEAPISIGDYDDDGVPDLMVNFNRTALIGYILSQNITFGNVTLTLTGQLRDRIPFRGSCIIAVSDLAGDVNCDGVVDIYDISGACISYDSKEGESNWNPNANYAPPYNKIDIFDIVTIASQYGETYP